ncbi:hypothetical protein PRZ48_000268 [Zasmidium cellare]|uniref:DNA replication ATP-dependent helicase/nuclease n=1 Tax=Zasmidium cellare TaxID=395010 RepID=A0ABR0EXZ4_ZASCE|nr:hypothetical protein PRZ48_000268 [Zasmidium cellare]
MATRTKSFFDQDHQRKPRPGQWSRRPHDRPPTNETPTNPAPPKPPIPATSQAKSKLQAFQFVAAGPVETPKENTATADHNMGDESGSGSLSAQSNKTDGTPQLPHANTFPCTPGARLPLEDLIGNCDETIQKEPVHESPEEQIGWHPQSSSDLLTPNQRKRKRAKSSSPSCPNTSSQQERASGFFGESGAPSAKKTPAADPATDLWQRYANGRANGETLNIPEIGNLIFQASPRPIETPVKGGPLRRWASTGNDWPSTKNKKRCTGTRQSINVWQDQTAVESGGKSKVATMVQKIQETLASQKLEQAQAKAVARTADAPSSSSPLPEIGAEGFPTPAAVSPLQSRQANVKSPLRTVQPPLRIQELKPPSQRPQFRPTQSGGFRTESSRPVGDPLNPGTAGSLHLHSKAPLPAYKRPSITKAPSQPKVPQVIAPPRAPAANKDFDDFGDDAFDLTADDLDELLSQAPVEQRALYDIPQHPNPPSQVQSKAIPQDAPPRPQAETITLDDDDEFGDDDLDEDSFVQAEFSATQAQRMSPRRRSPRKKPSPCKSQTSGHEQYTSPFQRYVVKQIIDGEYTNDKGRRCPEKLVLAEDWRSSKVTAITLRGSWMSTSLCKGNVIHVARLRRSEDTFALDSSLPGQVTIDDKESSPFLIVHPDHMLSATTVADSFDCVRKAVLQDRIKATGETSKAMVYGKILHEIFQQALSANTWDDSFMSSLVDKTVQAHVEGLWELGMVDTNLATEEIKAKMGELAAWANVFVRETPNDASLVDDKQGEKVWMSISKLIAIEEHIWSPQFGLKGNVDATIQTTLIDNPKQPGKNLIVPFEVKTGRTTQSPAHRAQTALYTLLLSDRYDVAVEAGILYYLESSSMSRIAPPIIEVRQMVQQRNRLASYIFRARNPPKAPKAEGQDVQMPDIVPQSQEIEESGLPTLLKNPFKCGRCYAQQSCFTFHALVENGSADSAGMIDDNKKDHSLVWKEAVGHLLASRSGFDADMLKQWFTKWDKLLTFEEGDQARFRKELWTMSSTEREALGRCFGNLVLKQDLTNTATSVTQQAVDGIEGSGGKINRYAYVFTRAKSSPSNSFTDGSQLTVGEPIVISSEQGQWALANGYIVAIAKHEITVAVDRKLGDARQRMHDFDDKTNQAFKGTMTVGNASSTTTSSEQMLYRLDKDEFSNGLALVRNNLVTLMSSHPIHTKLRNQIVFGAKPAFEEASAAPDHMPTQLGAMNEDQQAAVSRVLNAQDYALILGMPGTGKTTTIAHIIRALLDQGKSILLTSFTHTAVDNILLKIRDVAPSGSILRLGVPAKINTQVQEFCQLAATPRQSIQEVEDAYMGTRIVATTCMGTNHALFHRRTFDVCIVDEASQITLPTILGPLLYARKFVLVGDHFQLPPLVQNKAALEGGMDVSLFRQLSEEHGDAVAALGRQYRMCAEIMMLSNELIYHGKLRCGNDEVASRTIKLPTPDALERFHRSDTDCQDCWIQRLTAASAKVAFANTDHCGKQAMETLTAGGKNITNQLEALVSAELVLSLLAMGVPARDIGVITLYRSQLSLMRQLFKKAGVSADVEIDSADRYQGRDKECIILSMVRSNDVGVVGDLLKDWRRVNVALTRARSKLIVLGSRRTLVNNELLAKFLALVDREKWAMDLPPGCEEMHGFDFSTQVTQQLVIEDEESNPSARRSPAKKLKSSQSPSKKLKATQSSRGILQPGSGNVVRSPAKSPGKKHSPKRIQGGKGSRMTEKLRLAKEKIAMEMMFDEGEFGDELMDV